MTVTPIRTTGAVCLVLAPLVYAATRLTWPDGSDGSNSQVVSAAATHPGAWNFAGVLEAFSALLALAGALVLAASLSGRGRALGRWAAGFSACGAVGFVGNWTVNAELAAQANALPHDRALAAYNAAVHSSYLLPFIVLLLLGMFGGIFVLLTALRARMVPWWVVALGVLGVAGELAVEEASAVAAVPVLVQVVAAAFVARSLLSHANSVEVASSAASQPVG